MAWINSLKLRIKTKHLFIAAFCLLLLPVIFLLLPTMAYYAAFYFSSIPLLLIPPLVTWLVAKYLWRAIDRIAVAWSIGVLFIVIAHDTFFTILGTSYVFTEDRAISLFMGTGFTFLISLLAIPAIVFTNPFIRIGLIMLALVAAPFMVNSNSFLHFLQSVNL